MNGVWRRVDHQQLVTFALCALDALDKAHHLHLDTMRYDYSSEKAKSIIIHSPPPSPPQESPAKRLKIFIDKGKTVINLDPEPTPPPSPSPAPELKDVEVIESSIRPTPRHLPQIRAPPPDEAGPSIRRPSPPPPASRSLSPTII
ncbi:basic proline-rich protein-like [Abrus precatorius]|uniref:Basic proline-rich protein-like n=1 Tax=Abrus precatorius TaxID=3816 RepID=A0A8B8KTN7_ABRPR|nr:basic proline-rich protein-like [Abrus precatorius]